MNEKGRKKYWLSTTFVGIMLMVFGSGEAQAETEKSAESAITKIRGSEGWSYHVGDFERDEQGRPVGIHDDAAWTPYKKQEVRRGQHAVVWFKRMLPKHPHPNPVMYLSSYEWSQELDVYLHDRLIYTFDRPSSVFKSGHSTWKWPLIPLPPEYSGKEIFFRCDAVHSLRPLGTLSMGGFNELFMYSVFDLDVTILGIIFMIIGIVGYIVFVAVYRMHNAALCAFASLAMFSGIHTLVTESDLSLAFVTHFLSLSFSRHTYYMSYFLFMAGLWAFMAHTPWLGLKWVSRLTWRLHVACVVAVLVFERVDERLSALAHHYSLMLMAVGIGVYMIEGIKAIIRKNREARILAVGFVIFAIFSFADILSTLKILTFSQVPFISRVSYGTLGLILSLTYLLVLRYQSERRQAEDVIRNSEERLAGIIVALTDAIIMIDDQGLIVWVNEIATSLFGSDLINRTYTEVLSHVRKSGEPCPVKACFQDGHTHECETELPSDDGNRRHFWCVTNVAARHADGSPKTVIHVLRDITDMKRLQTEAAHSARLASLGELAAGVAHEINNPISGIIGCAEVLIDDCQEQGISLEIPEVIIQQGRRIAKITGNLLSFSRKQPHVLTPVQMQEVIADAVALEAKLFQKSRIIIRHDIPDQLPTVMADKHQLQQVLINLLNNARYALDQTNEDQQEDKVIEIQCTMILLQDRQYIRTSVYDNGPGIPEDMLDKICDPFYTSKPRGEGTGLGLSISYGIIKDHDGQLFFESQEGAYTKAIIDLPVITT